MKSKWWKIWIWNRYGEAGVKWIARKDAKTDPPIPAWDDASMPPFLAEIVRAGNQTLSHIAQQWQQADRTLLPAWLHAKRDLAHLSRQKDTTTLSAGQAREQYQAIHGKSPTLQGRNSAIWYVLFLIAVFILEFPLNSAAFNLLKESVLFTWMTTGVIAVALLGAAHGLGSLLKEGKWHDRVRVVWVAALTLSAFGAVVAVSFFRGNYAVSKGVATADDVATFRFLYATLNGCVFAVAAYMAYHSHHAGYAAVEQTRRRLVKLNRLLTNAQKCLHTAEVAREKAFEIHRNRAERIEEEVPRLAAVYRQANLYHRPDRGGEQTSHQPKSFALPVACAPSKDLIYLNWREETAEFEFQTISMENHR